MNEKLPAKLGSALVKGVEIHAWNATFERLIMAHALKGKWPAVKLEQFHCTAAAARASGWPRSLQDSAKFAGLPIQKDTEGARVMMRMCRPLTIEPLTWSEDPEDFERLYEYCLKDHDVERALSAVLRSLDERERALYLATERLNDAGWRVDLPLARRAVAESDKLKAGINRRVQCLTGGKITAITQNDAILKWLNSEGMELDSLEEKKLRPVLNSDSLPENCREVIELRLKGARAAVSKFSAMLERADTDGKLRGLYMYHGAGQTGRFTAQGVQVHNLLRDSKPELAAKFLKNGVKALSKSDPLRDMAALVRPAFLPAKKKKLVVGDWRAIEAIVLPWLAEKCGIDTGGYLEAWRAGKQIYEMQAAEIFGVDISKVTSDQRRSGKICVLAFGYQGGPGAYQSMARNYGESVDDKTAAKYCQAWRAANEWAPKFWRALEKAALMAVRDLGTTIDLGGIKFLYLENALYMRLPSRRVITYPFACLTLSNRNQLQVIYRRGNRKPKAGAPWPTVSLYGGLLAENATQGVSRDVLADTLLRSEKGKLLNVVGHTHDEVVADFSGSAKRAEQELRRLMTTAPDWGSDLPLSAEIWTGDRYG
jgi:DNA polymerase